MFPGELGVVARSPIFYEPGCTRKLFMAIFKDEKLQKASAKLYGVVCSLEGKTKVGLVQNPDVVVDPQQVAFEIGRTRQELADHFVLIQSLMAVVNGLLA
jgi:hypothetical protein